MQRSPRPHASRRDSEHPRVVSRRGVRRGRDMHVPVHATSIGRVGIAGPGGRDQPCGRASGACGVRALRHARASTLRGGVHRPYGNAALQQRPRPVQRHLRCAFPGLLHAGQVPHRGRGRRPPHRDLAGYSRGEGRIGRIRQNLSRVRLPRAGSGAGHVGHQRPHAAWHRHRERHDDAGSAGG